MRIYLHAAMLLPAAWLTACATVCSPATQPRALLHTCAPMPRCMSRCQLTLQVINAEGGGSVTHSLDAQMSDAFGIGGITDEDHQSTASDGSVSPASPAPTAPAAEAPAAPEKP